MPAPKKKSPAKRTQTNKTRKAPPRPQGETIFALDIGTRTVVGVLGVNKNDKFCIKDVITVEHTHRAMIDGQIEDIAKTAEIVGQVKTQLEKRNNIKLRHAAIAAAGRALKTIRQTDTFDISDKERLTSLAIKAMELEVVRKAQDAIDKENKDARRFYCVGHSAVRYELDDYPMSNLEGHSGQKVKMEIIAAFLPVTVVESLYRVMELNGLEVSSLTLEPIAAMNVIIPPEIRLINIALTDIGAGTSDIAVAKDGLIFGYAMATTAGDEITEQAIKTFFVDFATAEKIKQCSSGEITYKDIFGISHTLTAEQIQEKLSVAVDTLADTVCAAINEANGGFPAAVFLVGGGSMVRGLAPLVAQKLGLDEGRVAVGQREFLRDVDDGGFTLGAEMVTPVGIGLTAMRSLGYDFATITLNGEKIRLFDTRRLTVLELLSAAGYKATQIMGRSGSSLSFTLNGERKLIKGGAYQPAQLTLNGSPAPLTASVSQGDVITLIPAVSGQNAKAVLSDVVEYEGEEGEVYFYGHTYPIGTHVTVNGNPQPKAYEICLMDDIRVQKILTLSDLLHQLEAPTAGVHYTINGIPADINTTLKNGDVIDLLQDETTASPIVERKDIKQETSPKEPVLQETKETFTEEAATESAEEEVFAPTEINVTLNGKPVTLTKGESYAPTFLDLLNFVDIDPKNPKGDILLLLNNRPATYSDALKDGDVAVIQWEELHS